MLHFLLLYLTKSIYVVSRMTQDGLEFRAQILVFPNSQTDLLHPPISCTPDPTVTWEGVWLQGGVSYVLGFLQMKVFPL